MNRNKQDQGMKKEALLAIIQKVKDLESGLEDLKNYTDETFRSNVADIRQYHNKSMHLCENLCRILPLVKEAGKLNQVCERCSRICTTHFINISSGLQYHDIIDQKITHIIEINQRLLTELLSYQNGELQVVFHISLLHEIIAYFKAQIELIQKEYNSSFEEIKKQFFSLKIEAKEIDEVSWKERETPLFSEDQTFSLSEHLEQCWTFDTEIMQKIIEIHAGIESKDIIINLMKVLKEISAEPDSFRLLNAENEKEEAIEALSQIFTMEAERLLWKSIFHGAGFTAVLNDEEEEENSDSIDLF